MSLQLYIPVNVKLWLQGCAACKCFRRSLICVIRIAYEVFSQGRLLTILFNKVDSVGSELCVDHVGCFNTGN